MDDARRDTSVISLNERNRTHIPPPPTHTPTHNHTHLHTHIHNHTHTLTHTGGAAFVRRGPSCQHPCCCGSSLTSSSKKVVRHRKRRDSLSKASRSFSKKMVWHLLG